MDWLKCNICFNTYNDSHLRPRVLSCGHSFCERCLKNTIQNKTLTCPQCRKIHEINSVIDLPINFIVDGLLKSLNPCSQDVNEGAISKPIAEQCDQDDRCKTCGSLKSILQQDKSLSTQKELLKTSAGMCNEHSSKELIYRCSSHKCWVCEKCIEERGDHPKHYCSIKSFKKEIEDRREEHKITIENEEKSFNESLLQIERHISFLSDKQEHHSSLVDILQDLVKLHKKEDENLQSEMKSFEKMVENGKSIKQRLLETKVTALNVETLDESNTARDVVEKNKTDARDWIKDSEKEVNEGKLKVQTSINLEMASKGSLEYREKLRLLQEELEAPINQSEPNEPLQNYVNSKDVEFMAKNESRISENTNDEVCKAHHKAIGHRCLTCQRWTCDICHKSHTTVTGCITISSCTALKYMKDENNESTDVLLSVFEEDTIYLFSKIQKLNDNIQEITDKKKKFSEKAAAHAKEIKKIQSLLEQGKKLKENVVKSKKHISTTNSPNAVMDRIEVLDETKQALRIWAIMNLGRDISDEGFSQYMNKYDRLQRRIPSCPLVFMELSLGGEMKGKIMIKLDVNLPKSREHMVNIVTGKDGVSLAGIDLDFYDDDCLGKDTLPFSEVNVTPDSSETSISEKGDVVLYYRNDYLSAIYFQVGTYEWFEEPRSNFRVVGTIITGLDFIQECYDNHSCGVQIMDCGLVLGEWE